jgi:hypothetical protein
MVRRANDVVKLLEDLRRMYASGPSRGVADGSGLASAGDERPPKRPWEDISKHGDPEGGPYHEVCNLIVLLLFSYPNLGKFWCRMIKRP